MRRGPVARSPEVSDASPFSTTGPGGGTGDVVIRGNVLRRQAIGFPARALSAALAHALRIGGYAQDLSWRRRADRRCRNAAPEADRRRSRAHERTAHALERGRPAQPAGSIPGGWPDRLQPDDLGVRRRDLGTARRRRADRRRHHEYPGRGPRGAAGRGVQLLRPSAHRRLQGGDWPRGRRLHGVPIIPGRATCRHERVSGRTRVPIS